MASEEEKETLKLLEDEEFYKAFLLEQAKRSNVQQQQRIEFIPKPGFVLKTKTLKGEKVFINICTSEKVPSPRDISEEELAELISSETADPTQFRVPMSLGEPHAEVDKSGKGIFGSQTFF